MTTIDVVMCAGYSPSARAMRKALRNMTESEDIRVISPCPAGAGLARYKQEISSLAPETTLVVEGCDGCCGSQGIIRLGIAPAHIVVLSRYPIVDDKTVQAVENEIRMALKELKA